MTAMTKRDWFVLLIYCSRILKDEVAYVPGQGKEEDLAFTLSLADDLLQALSYEKDR